MILNLIPFKSVGEFTINSPIDIYKEYDFELTKDQDDIGIDSYSLDEEGLILYVNQKTKFIEWVSCTEECLFKGRNLIGMGINDFIIHTDTKYVGEPDSSLFEEDDIPQVIYEFEEIGLQVWTKKNIIVTVIASSE